MKVAVFGAGTMGSGIAQVFAAHGHTTLMYASSVASAQRHKDKLDASLQKRVEKGKMTQEAKDALMANIFVEEKSAAADADHLYLNAIHEIVVKFETHVTSSQLYFPEKLKFPKAMKPARAAVRPHSHCILIVYLTMVSGQIQPFP